MPYSYQILNFEFHGRASSVWTANATNNSEEIQDIESYIEKFNTRTTQMNNAIETAVKHKLPPEYSVQAHIEFKAGSLEWSGLISIFTYAGGIATVISLTEYLVRAVKFSINAVIREHANALNVLLKDPETTVIAVESPVPSEVHAPTTTNEPDTTVTPQTFPENIRKAVLEQGKLINRLSYGVICNAIISLAILVAIIIILVKS